MEVDRGDAPHMFRLDRTLLAMGELVIRGKMGMGRGGGST